ncbi:MAG: NAD-dependent epimerase/dehydratase family protein [Vicinamibacterales bacterium]|nr:NAD-dependent epimerase/dehydratase family protein [Vicinamibacterales bacterium]
MTTSRLAGQRVLVTGATGFIGGHLLPTLLDRGAEVHAMSTRPHTAAPGPVRWHRADLRRPEEVAAVVHAAEPTVVFHLAAYGASADQRDTALLTAVNVDGTRTVWEALPPATRFVMTGTCAEYGEVAGPAVETRSCHPASPYAAAKHAAVRLVVEGACAEGRPAVILRPYGPYGPADHPSRVIPSTIAGLLRGDEVAVTGGQQRRDFSYVTDHVEALVLAATREGLAPGAIYNIGSGVAITLRDALEQVAAIVDGPGRLAFGARPYRDDEIWEMVPDVSAAARDLGFGARVSFEDGLRRTAAWTRAHLAGARA